MKYVIASLSALVLCQSVMAQTGLSYNQCLTFGGNEWIDNTPSNNNDGRETQPFEVPAGKVWKIEFASVKSSSSPTIYINNHYATSLLLAYNPFPIWCKSGDIIKLKFDNQASGYEEFFISILEFNAN